MKKTVFDLFPGFFGVFSRYAYPRASKRDMKSLVDSLERDEIVLDLASGTGIPSTFFINKKGLKFVLLDLSINMLRKSPFAASRVVGKAENLPFKDKVFGLILCGLSFHHFDDQESVMKELKRIIKPKGRFYIFEIDTNTTIGRVISLIDRIFNRVFFIEPQKFRKLAEKTGFIANIKRYDWRYALIGEPKALSQKFPPNGKER